MTTETAAISLAAPLTPGNLGLINSTYALRSLVMGDVQWRRETAESPYVDGGVQIAAVLGKPQGTAVVRVTGTSHSDLQTKLNTLFAAFKQTSFVLSLTIDGSSYGWLCDCADYRYDFDFLMRHRKVAMATFSFPRDPTPVLGGPF